MPEYDEVVSGPLAAERPADAGSDDAEQGALVSWGEIQFGAKNGYAALRRSAEYRQPAIERIRQRPLRQAVGQGPETITLEGVTFPAWGAGPEAVQALRDAAATGEARMLLDGRGRSYGRWAATRVEESWAALRADGQPRRVEYSLELALVAEAPGGEAAALRSAAGDAGDVAGVVAAVASAATPAEAVASAEERARVAWLRAKLAENPQGNAEVLERPGSVSASRRVLDAVRAAVGGGLPAMRRAALAAAARLPGAPPLGRAAAAVAYRAAAGDALDAIAWRQYGRESAVLDVLRANPGIAGLPPVLPAATLVGLPRAAAPSTAARQVVQLWT